MKKKLKKYNIDLNLELPHDKILKDFIVDMKNYITVSVIGKGMYGVVSLVKDKRTGQKYASKELKFEKEEEERQNEKLFKREVEIMASFDNYALLGLRGFTEYKKNVKPHILTEYCQKGELSSIIKEESKGLSPSGYDETQKLIIAYGIARGMQVLHKKKIIHRDIKPENIFLNELYEPKIADFGLSKMTEGTIFQSETVGTPLFMAPELLNEVEYTDKVDVYAYGMLLYNLIELEIPFHYLGEINMFILTKHINNGERPEFVIPTSYEDLIVRCWDQNPDDRPTFKEIVEELENMAETSDEIEIEHFDLYKEKLTQDESKAHRARNSKPVRRKPTGQKTIIQKLKEAANDGNVASQIELANRYQKGEGVTKDLQRANHFFKLAAKNGDIGAMVRYGVCLQEGIGMEKPDYEKAADYFEKAIEKGKAKNDKKKAKNDKKKAKNDKKKAENPTDGEEEEDIEMYEGINENAMYYYSILLLEGKGVAKDEKKGLKYLKAAADLHQSYAQNKYGMMLEFGKGVEKDIIKAIEYYKSSADEGNEVGMFNYADALEKGKYVEQDLKKAAFLFRLSYKRGYAPAICRYGEMLLEGRGVEADVDEARRLFLLAINNNYPSAYVSLGQMYLTGNGFEKNEEEATRLFKIAADAGNPRGMIQYGVSLEEGIGCTRDVPKAFDLYKKCIARGSTIALTKAAKLLLLGENGVDEDLPTAIDYLTQAKENGDEEAAAILDELNDDKDEDYDD